MSRKCCLGGVLIGCCVSTLLAESNEGASRGQEQKKLEPLVVTGLSETQQSLAPSSVGFISAETVSQLGIMTARESLKLIPNVALTQSDSARATSFSVRGSRELTFHEFSGGRSGVGYYLDDIPVLDAYGRDFTLFDVEGISFYKGPHGSSMGVPHSMGVVDIVTRAPDKDSRGEFSYRYGSYEAHELKGHVSGAISENLFLGLDGYFAKDEGWFEDRLSGDPYGKHETVSGRARLRWIANENLEFNLTVGAGSHDDDPPVYLNTNRSSGFYDVYSSPAGYSKGDQNYQALQAIWKNDGWQVKSITSHRDTQFEDNDPAFLQSVFHPGRLPRMRDMDISSWTQEVRVESTDADAAWQWRTGLFLSTRDSNLDHYMLGLGPWEGANEMRYELDDYVLYGEVTRRVNECLELSAGLRFQTLRDHTTSSFDPTAFAESIGGQALSMDRKDDFSAVLPMAAASWEWSDSQLSYVRFSTGMQPGGLAVASAGSVDYDSEYSRHYELGHDSSFHDGTIQSHVAVFYTDYDDYQSFQFNPAGPTIYKSDDAHAFGIEAEVTVSPVSGLDLYAGVGYTKAKFDDFKSPTGDFSGSNINNIPVGTINLGAEYRTDWGGVARLDWRYVGDTWFDEGNTVKQDAYSTLAARIGYERGDFGIYLYGSNLFDEEYHTQAYLFQGVPAGAPGVPRIVGVEMKASF